MQLGGCGPCLSLFNFHFVPPPPSPSPIRETGLSAAGWKPRARFMFVFMVAAPGSLGSRMRLPRSPLPSPSRLTRGWLGSSAPRSHRFTVRAAGGSRKARSTRLAGSRPPLVDLSPLCPE